MLRRPAPRRPTRQLQVVVHSSSVTIALSGFLSQSGASTAVEVCEALPADVRTVHLDLTHLRLYDVAALDSVIDGLNSWESARRGFVSVAAPRQATAP